MLEHRLLRSSGCWALYQVCSAKLPKVLYHSDDADHCESPFAVSVLCVVKWHQVAQMARVSSGGTPNVPSRAGVGLQ